MSVQSSLRKQEANKPLKTHTIKEALQRASFCLQEAGIDQPRKEAEILLGHIMNTDQLQLFLNKNNELSPENDNIFQKAIYRRCQGEPVAYIIGEKHFFGNRFIVNQNVLIPRPETELMIESALRWSGWLNNLHRQKIKCIDLGSGSGILAVSIALLLPRAEVWAVDSSKAALQTAKLNAGLHKVKDKINWVLGSYFDALEVFKQKPQFNLILANPPYLTGDDIKCLPKEIRQYEPIDALYGGQSGLEGYRLILSRLAKFAEVPALLVMEVGAGQKVYIEKICSETGLFSSMTWRYDLGGWPRVLEGIIS